MSNNEIEKAAKELNNRSNSGIGKTLDALTLNVHQKNEISKSIPKLEGILKDGRINDEHRIEAKKLLKIAKKSR